MADDEKILRIEAKFTGDEKPLSSKPASDTTQQDLTDNLSSQEKDRQKFDKLEHERLHQEEIDRLVASLKHEEETPLFPAEVTASQQLSAEDAFGSHDLKRQAIPTDDGPEDVNNLIKGFQLFNGGGGGPAGGTAANAAAGAAGQLIGGAIGGAAGGPPGAAVGAAAGGAAGGAASNLAHLAMQTAIVGSEFLALVSIVAVAEKLIDSTFKGMAAGWEEISGTIQAAEAAANVQVLQEQLATEHNVSGVVSDVAQSRADLQTSMVDLLNQILNLIGPFLELIQEGLATIVDMLSAVLQVVNIFILPVKLLAKLASTILAVLPKFMKEESEGDFLKDVNDALTNPTILTPNVPLFGDSRPRPQASRPDIL